MREKERMIGKEGKHIILQCKSEININKDRKRLQALTDRQLNKIKGRSVSDLSETK